MSNYKVRKIEFRFSDDIPFQSCPNNPQWGNFVNVMALMAPGLERYFIRAFRDAMPRIRNETVRREADWFCQQEAQHARQHLAHLRLLSAKYPGLDETAKAVSASFEGLLTSKSLEFALSYAATLELAFGPTAKFMITHRNELFCGGDARIASFILWHFVEEFEHRNAAFNVFKDVVGSHTYRLRTLPQVIAHLTEVWTITQEGMRKHVPIADCLVDPALITLEMFQHISLKQQLIYAYEIVCSFLPYHKPDNIRQPEWVTRWFAADEANKDMAVYYPS